MEAGDTLDHVTDATVERDRAARRASTTTTVHESVVSDLLVADAAEGASIHETAQRLQTLLAGASPDEVKALRTRLFAKLPQADKGPDPDTELHPKWRDGRLPRTRTCSAASATRRRSTACRWSCSSCRRG
jgi:hypothetical protein